MDAHFTHKVKKVYDTNILSIVDLDRGRTVTNNIEKVLERIVYMEQIMLNKFLIIYRDTEGYWDGYDSETKKFIALRTEDEDLAIRKIIEKSIKKP